MTLQELLREISALIVAGVDPTVTEVVYGNGAAPIHSVRIEDGAVFLDQQPKLSKSNREGTT